MRQVSAFLALIFLLCLLTACGPDPTVFPGGLSDPTRADTRPAVTQATEPTATEPSDPTSLPELAPLTGARLLGDEGVAGLWAGSEEAAILLLRWDQGADAPRCRVLLADPDTAAVTATVELALPEGWMDLSRFAADGEGFLLIDEAGERCAVFDRSGACLGLRDYPTMSQANLGWQNRLLNDGCFWKGPDFALFHDAEDPLLGHVVGFYDETDRLHGLDEDFDDVAACAGHRLLLQQSGEGGESLVCRLADLDAGVMEGELALRCGETAAARWVNACGAALGDGWALLAVEWREERVSYPAVYFWRPAAETARPLEAATLTEAWLTRQIAACGAALEAQGFALRLDEAPPAALTPTLGLAARESVCETGASLFGQYRILRQLRDFVDKLPQGLVRELRGQTPEQEDPDRDSLCLYVVRSVPGDAAAFANAWSEPMLLCFATEEFTGTQLAHEFMHLMEYRLAGSLGSARLERDWQRLNPAWAYDADLTPEQAAQTDAWFVSAYARTNAAEDRAETFQRLFDNGAPTETARWCAGRPGVRAKAAWLIQNIRAAFPSVQATETAWWEKASEQP